MSSIYSQGLAASASGLNEPECEPSRSARLTPIAGKSSPNIGRASPAMMISEPSPPIASEQTAFPWMQSAEASPVKISALREKVLALRASGAGYGRTTPDLLANFDPDTSSWRTSQHSLEGGLTEFSETWPRSGTMRNGTAYQLPPLVRLTDETGSGLLPTPRAQKFGWTDSHGSISAWARLIPTPTACDHKGSGRLRLERGPNNNLRDFFKIHYGMLYPPVRVVEWLMGYPIGHTALEPSETPSSRKSRKSSGAQS